MLKKWVWIIALVLLALWSLGNWFAMQMLDVVIALWPAQGVALPTSVPWPSWMQLWFDAGQLNAWLELLQSSIAWLHSLGPSAETWQNLLVLGLWLVWGFGAACLLAVAVVVHIILSRSSRSEHLGPA